jgi:hypothetical protein
VVFKYTNIIIATGKKVTFKNHATRAPVVWLVSGNVSIAGTVDLSGESARDVWSSPLDGWVWESTHRPLGGRLTEPGPGGFRGGAPLKSKFLAVTPQKQIKLKQIHATFPPP